MTDTADQSPHQWSEERAPVDAHVWDGIHGDRCSDVAGYCECDLVLGHDGPHLYIKDHDAEGDVSLLATWPQQEVAPDGR